jgi:hypothetical protein
MTIIFLGKEAQTFPGMQSTFTQTHVPNGLRGVCTAIETRTFLLEVASWSTKSKTAKEVLAAVHASDKEVYLVGMKGGYQCFSSDEPSPGKGVIYIDVEAKLGVRVQGPHGETVASLHNYIATLHEFGHAKQWIERPDFFAGGAQNTPDFANKIKAAAFSRLLKTAPSGLTYGQQRTLVNNHLQHTNMKMTKPAWSVRIETDNLIHHEWPICREMGYPVRQYTDLVML